nr:hypothetical protein [Tanacetum cinerariifolium]
MAAMEQVLDLKTKRFEDVVGRLKAYEERVKEEDKANVPQENLLYEKRDLSHIQCYRCDQEGHFVSKGPEHKGNLNETQEKGVYHEEGNYSYFSELNENITGHVRFGYGSCVSIKGKGLILFQGKNREHKLWKDVYYIPTLRSNVISLGQATISSYDISIRGDLTMRDSCGDLLIKVMRIANRLYKAQLKVEADQIWNNETMGLEAAGHEQPIVYDDTIHGTVHVTVAATLPGQSPQNDKEDEFGSYDMLILLARLDTVRLLIALAAGKGWKIHHLDLKTTFINGDRKKLNSTSKEIGFLQCMHEKAVYRKVYNGGFIIVAICQDDLFVIGVSLDLINKFKKRMSSQFEILDLGELTYYLGIEVSQGKVFVDIKQERYARKIFNEADMEDFNATLYLMKLGLNHYVDIDDERSTTGHVFYLGTSPITWCSQKQTTVVLSSCEAKFMAATAAACQAIWLSEVLAEVMENEQDGNECHNRNLHAILTNGACSILSDQGYAEDFYDQCSGYCADPGIKLIWNSTWRTGGRPDLDTFNSVRIPKHSSVVWKKKGSSNTSNVGLSAVSVPNLNKNVKRYSRKDLLA